VTATAVVNQGRAEMSDEELDELAEAFVEKMIAAWHRNRPTSA